MKLKLLLILSIGLLFACGDNASGDTTKETTIENKTDQQPNCDEIKYEAYSENDFADFAGVDILYRDENGVPYGFTGLVKTGCYENGKVKNLSNFKNGEYEGISRSWYENGQLQSKKIYKNMVLAGLQIGWYESGQLKYQENHNEDGKVSHKSWHENGTLNAEGNYINNLGPIEKYGLWRGWYDNGKLQYEGKYEDGKKDGLWKGWYDSGQLYVETTYCGDRYADLRRFWHANGQLALEATYDRYDVNRKYNQGDLNYKGWESLGPLNQKCWDENANIIDCSNIDWGENF